MNTHKRFLLILILAVEVLLPTEWSHAQTVAQKCDTSVQSMLWCIGERSPNVLRSQAAAHEGDALIDVAREWRNPELNIQALQATTKSDVLGDSVQATGLYTLDLAGVRNARHRSASLEAQERRLKSQSEKQTTLVQGYLQLLRIHLLQQELELLGETETSLEKNLAEFKRRPRLSAEQQASKTIFTLALQGQRRQRTIQEQDYHALIHDLEIQINEKFEPTAKNLPPAHRHFEPLSAVASASDAPERQQIDVLREKAKALAEQVRAEKKPLLSVGPSLEWDRNAGQTGYRVGVAMQFPLPFFERFNGTHELTARSKLRAESEAATRLRELEGELAHSTEIYQSAIEALKDAESAEKTRERIAQINHLFAQGLVSGASVVETMRQGLALLQSNDELVLRATAAMCKVRMLENKVEECWK